MGAVLAFSVGSLVGCGGESAKQEPSGLPATAQSSASSSSRVATPQSAQPTAKPAPSAETSDERIKRQLIEQMEEAKRQAGEEPTMRTPVPGAPLSLQPPLELLRELSSELKFESIGPCLKDQDKALRGIFAAGGARIAKLVFAKGRIEAFVSCGKESTLKFVDVFPSAAAGVRYTVHYVEAGLEANYVAEGARAPLCSRVCTDAVTAAAKEAWLLDMGDGKALTKATSELERTLTQAILAGAKAP